MEHRSDYAEWEVRKENATGGYATEEKEWLESRVDPAPQLKEKMIFNKRPPEEERMELDTMGNEYAESGLLSVAFHDPAAVQVLKQLSPHEFTDPLNQIVAKSVVYLEDKGVRASAVAVENYMRERNVVTSPVWDSTLARSDMDASTRGLRGWELGAGVYENAKFFAAEIRSNTQASQTAEVGTWIQERMSKEFSAGVDPERTKQVQREIRSKLDQVAPDLPQVGLASPSPDWQIRRLTPLAPHHSPAQSFSRSRT
jgi:hypothetical protein